MTSRTEYVFDAAPSSAVTVTVAVPGSDCGGTTSRRPLSAAVAVISGAPGPIRTA